MEPEIVRRDAFTVLGVLARTGVGADIQQIWMDQFMQRHDEVRPFSVDQAYYGVDYMPLNEQFGEYLAGMAVPEGTVAPHGLVARRVPAALYAVCQCTVDTVPEAAERVFSEWLPRSEYERDYGAPGIEYYPANTERGSSPVLVYLPVRPRNPHATDRV